MQQHAPISQSQTVSASASQTGNPASYAVDKNLNTRWSNKGLGSWIQVNLGEEKVVCSIGVNWYSGNTRVMSFDISVSNDGINFVKIFSGDSGKTLSEENYNFADVTAKYVRVTVTKNTENNYASIYELKVYGYSSSSEPGPGPEPGPTPNTCANLPISAVSASASQTGNPASNAVDKNLNTRWSNEGLNSWIQVNLGEEKVVCSIGVNWYNGNTRVMSFDISVSNDGINFVKIFSGDSGKTLSEENYNFADVTAKYVRVTVTKNTENNWASISELKVYGYSSTGGTNSPPLANNQQISTTANLPKTITLTASDANNDALNYSIVTGPAHASLSGQPPVVSYMPSPSYVGTDSFTFKVSDGKSDSNVATVSINVLEPSSNHPPVANSQQISTTIGTAKTTTLTGSDPDSGDIISFFITVQPSHGSLSGDLPIVTYTPQANYEGPDSFKFVTNDKKANSDEATVSITVAKPPGGTDQFGIRKLYDTKAGGEEWYMNMVSPTSDSRFDPKNTITKNADGSWKMKATQVRMNVFTSTGYSQSKIATLDQGQLEAKGYMQAPNDWKNVETTMYVKTNSAPSEDNYAPYGRGGKHTGDGSPEGCEGTSLKGDVFFSGKVRFAKEQWHVSYVFTDELSPTTSIKGKWIGIKYIMYNFNLPSGQTAVKMELWLDVNNNGNFVKVDETTDSGGWGREGQECGGKPDQIITWGGPIVTFRWDTANDVDFKNLSVREIQPPT